MFLHSPAGKECGVGATITQRYTEALRVSDNDIGAQITRRLQQCEGEEICDHDGVDLVLLQITITQKCERLCKF